MILWMTWTCTWPFWAYFWNQVNSRYVTGNLWNSVGQLFRETGKLISEQKKTSLVYGLSISIMPRTCRQTYCVQTLVSSPTPKPTSSPTLCSACENGRWSYCNLWKSKIKWYSETSTSRMWIVSTECRPSPRIHDVGHPWRDSKI